MYASTRLDVNSVAIFWMQILAVPGTIEASKVVRLTYWAGGFNGVWKSRIANITPKDMLTEQEQEIQTRAGPEGIRRER